MKEPANCIQACESGYNENVKNEDETNVCPKTNDT